MNGNRNEAQFCFEMMVGRQPGWLQTISNIIVIITIQSKLTFSYCRLTVIPGQLVPRLNQKGSGKWGFSLHYCPTFFPFWSRENLLTWPHPNYYFSRFYPSHPISISHDDPGPNSVMTDQERGDRQQGCELHRSFSYCCCSLFLDYCHYHWRSLQRSL